MPENDIYGSLFFMLKLRSMTLAVELELRISPSACIKSSRKIFLKHFSSSNYLNNRSAALAFPPPLALTTMRYLEFARLWNSAQDSQEARRQPSCYCSRAVPWSSAPHRGRYRHIQRDVLTPNPNFNAESDSELHSIHSCGRYAAGMRMGVSQRP